MDTIAPIIWNEVSYTSWRHLELFRSTGTHYKKEILASKNIEMLMTKSMSFKQRNIFKSSFESKVSLNRKIKRLLKFKVLRDILANLITIVGFHTKKELDYELELLMIHIAKSYRIVELVSKKNARPGRDNISPFISHAIGIVGRYFIFNYIKQHTNYIEQTSNMGIPNVSVEFSILGRQVNLNDSHGHSLLNCMDLSHRIRGLVVIAIRDRSIIRSLNGIAGMRNMDNTQVMFESKHACQGNRLISHMDYFSGFENNPDIILSDPFHYFEQASEHNKLFDIALEKHAYIASKSPREIISQLDQTLEGIENGIKDISRAGISSPLLKKIQDLKIHTVSRYQGIFCQVEGAIAYIFSLTQDSGKSQLLENILLTSFRSITPRTRPESVKEHIKDALLFYILLEQISNIVVSISTENCQEENTKQLPTQTQYMYYYWYLTSSRMTKMRSGKHTTRSSKRNYHLGRKYLQYIQFCQDLDVIINQSPSESSRFFRQNNSHTATKTTQKKTSTSVSPKSLHSMSRDITRHLSAPKIGNGLGESCTCSAKKRDFTEALGSSTTIKNIILSTRTPGGVPDTSCVTTNLFSKPFQATHDTQQNKTGSLNICDSKNQSLHRKDMEIPTINMLETDTTSKEHPFLERLTGLSPLGIISDRLSSKNMDIDLNLSLGHPSGKYSHEDSLITNMDMQREMIENPHQFRDHIWEDCSSFKYSETQNESQNADKDNLYERKKQKVGSKI